MHQLLGRMLIRALRLMQCQHTAACVQGKVSGQLKVFFYDTEAGSRDVGPVVVPARASPQASAASQATSLAAPALSSAGVAYGWTARLWSSHPLWHCLHSQACTKWAGEDHCRYRCCRQHSMQGQCCRISCKSYRLLNVSHCLQPIPCTDVGALADTHKDQRKLR